MLTATTEDVLSWGPCWGHDHVRATLAPLGKHFTALDVLTRLPDVSVETRFWIVLREAMIPARTLRLFAVACARRALEAERAAGREPDPRSWAACEVAERFANGGATEVELGVAQEAAALKVKVTWASDAAVLTTRTAAQVAARAAALAARMAVWEADYWATVLAAREWQLATLITLLEATP